jgi:hypothetical protein
MKLLYNYQHGLDWNKVKDFEFEIQTKLSLFSLNSLQLHVGGSIDTLHVTSSPSIPTTSVNHTTAQNLEGIPVAREFPDDSLGMPPYQDV